MKSGRRACTPEYVTARRRGNLTLGVEPMYEIASPPGFVGMVSQ